MISVVSNEVPYAMSRLASLCLEGDYPAAQRMHRRLHALMEINFIESNPIPVKSTLAMMGLCEENYRLPLVPPSEETRNKLRAEMKSLGLLK